MRRLASSALAAARRRSVAQFADYNVEDPLCLDQELTPDELDVKRTIESYCKESLLPRVTDAFLQEKEDRAIFRELGDLGVLGPTITGYGCAGVSSVAAGLISRAIEAVDSGYRSAWSVQSSLVMFPIAEFGSDAQKEAYLPLLAKGEKIGCFGLTEPSAGSDPSSMSTQAKETQGGYLLNGSKMWITSSPFADVAVVWAKDVSNGGVVRGFLIDRGTKGFTTPTIQQKLSLRTSHTGSIELENCFVPHDKVLPGVQGLKGPFHCLSSARYGIAWGVMGAAQHCFDVARDYTATRRQFGRPLASTQLIQSKLADMATEIALGTCGALRAGRLKDSGLLAHPVISMLKRNNTKKAIEVARTARDMLGGNGIVAEYHVLRHAINLETVLTYEGTYDMHGLILGRAITGSAAF